MNTQPPSTICEPLAETDLIIPERLIRVIAGHEAGHLLMYRRFGSDGTASLTFGINSEITGGIALSDNQRLLTGFQRSCFGWGGIVAEHLLGFTLHPVSAPRLSLATCADWLDVMLPHLSKLSFEDQASIGRIQQLESLTECVRSLTSALECGLLSRLTKKLVSDFRAQFVEHRVAWQARFNPEETPLKEEAA